jgi:cytidylate kinase
MTTSSTATSSAIIAIDGPAAAGKGTLARRLAAHYGFAYLDTGLLYRAVGCRLLDQGDDPCEAAAAVAAARSLSSEALENPVLRSDEMALAASQVAVIPNVRQALLRFQQHFAASPPEGASGAVIDGRDIGTVVCPETPYKLFVTAGLEERANRRLKELRERGIESIHGRVLQEMKDRDARDSRRDIAPLAKSEGALLIDTTEMDAEKVFSVALDHLSKQGLAPPETRS